MRALPRITPVCVALLAWGGSGSVLAQQSAGGAAPAAAQPASASAAAAQPADAQQVVISGSKRPQRQREVAGTVAALSGDQLEQLGAQDQEDVFKLTPGVQLNKGDPDRALPTIRGVGTVSSANALAAQQATTGLYIEDVPFTDPWAFVVSADLAPFDLERVEVLRGPQGALYGSASLGGAVLYVLKKPRLGVAEGSLLGTVNSVSGGGLGGSLYAMANAPLGENAAVRVVAFDRRDSGYIHNLGTGQDEANALRQHGGRVQVAWRPVQALRINAGLLTQRTHVDDAFVVSPDPGKLEVNTPTASPRTSEFTLATLKLDADVAGQLLTSNTGYLVKHSNGQSDATRRFAQVGTLVDPGLPALTSVLAPANTRGKAFSQELRLASNGDGALSYVAGAFYARTTFDIDAAFLAPGGAAAWGPFGALLPDDALAVEKDHARATEAAVFADAEYRFGNGLSVGLGGRQYHNTLRYVANSGFFGTPLVADNDLSESGFTPKLSVKYRFGEQLWYALASKGYRFGGVNPVSNVRFNSDKLWNYETGLRLALMKGLQLDLSAFLMDWKDAQVNAVIPGPVPLNGIANVGKARVKGLEAALNWKATPVLALNASVAYTDARSTSDFTSNNGSVVPSGSRLPGTAKWQAVLQGSFDFSGPLDSSGRLLLTQSHVGQRALTLDAGGSAPAYDTTDLRVSFARDAWELGVSATNLFDRRGIAGGQVVQGVGGPRYTDYVPIRPRTVGVSLRRDF
jgi:outer membrane receptor protein involved in Fe transport